MLSEKSNNKRFAIELAYDGGSYHGWQIQPNAITVQEALNHALTMLLKEPINVVGAGRTDTGVHAAHFVAHFDLTAQLDDPKQLSNKLNSFLKPDIRIDRIIQVAADFHSRFSAFRRTYHYLLSLNKEPFMRNYAWQMNKELDFQAMNKAAEFLLGDIDFTSFARNHADVSSHRCLVDHAHWQVDEQYAFFEISANRFLRNMVRAIVGTLIDIGAGKSSPDQMENILDQKDRAAAGQSAPPQGLFLTKIEYPKELFAAQPKTVFPRLF